VRLQPRHAGELDRVRDLVQGDPGEELALVGAERCARTAWERLADVERALVTLARALVRRPDLLLVDDPAVGLGDDERERVVGLLRRQAQERGLGVLMAVGDRRAARRADRMLSLRDGRLIAADHIGSPLALKK